MRRALDLMCRWDVGSEILMTSDDSNFKALSSPEVVELYAILLAPTRLPRLTPSISLCLKVHQSSTWASAVAVQRRISRREAVVTLASITSRP